MTASPSGTKTGAAHDAKSSKVGIVGVAKTKFQDAGEFLNDDEILFPINNLHSYLFH